VLLPPTARIVLFTLALIALVGIFRPAEAPAARRSPEAGLLRAVNSARTAHGLHRVRIGSTLERYSNSWASYLLRHNAFYHGSLGYGTSENLGWLTCRRSWARALVRMWLNSPAHRPHLLAAGARRIGVGVATGRFSGYSCVRVAVTRFR
jgi:uncharacterized protein YkwD